MSFYLIRKLVLQKPNGTVDTMQQIASDINKMMRSLSIDSVIVV